MQKKCVAAGFVLEDGAPKSKTTLLRVVASLLCLDE
jgi:hypothetical protein